MSDEQYDGPAMGRSTRTNWKQRYMDLADACEGIPETLRQSAYLLEDGDIDGECAEVKEMARRLERALESREVRPRLRRPATGRNRDWW